jgi:hypothetical protein
MTASGVDGLDSASKQAAFLTPSPLVYPQTAENSPDPFLPVITQPSGPKMGHLRDDVTSPWSQVLRRKPQATWLRRFGAISNQAPFTSKGHLSCIPLHVPSSEPSKRLTQPLNDKKQQPQSCCEECSNYRESGLAQATTPPLQPLPSSLSSAISLRCARAKIPQLPNLAGPKSSACFASSSATIASV